MAEPLEYNIRLKQLKIDNFRCFSSLKLEFDDKLTVFIGGNGSGKSSLLDIIAEELKECLFQIRLTDGTERLLKGRDVRVGTEKSENDLFVQLDYPTQIVSYQVEENEPSNSMVREEEVDTIETTDSEVVWAPNVKKEDEVVLQEVEFDSRTEDNVAITIGISLDDKVNAQLSSLSIRRSFEEYALGSANKKEGNIILPVLVYFGCGDVLTARNDRNKAKHRLDYIYKGALSPARINFTAFYDWFETQYRLYLQKKVASPDLDMAALAPELFKIRKAVEDILNEDKDNPVYKDLRIEYGEYSAKMILEKKGDGKYQPFEIDQLSSGEKSLFAIVADLGLRLLNANPLTTSAQDDGLEILGKGIALIDEIDLHLHPKWQSTVIDKLLKIFPDMQWVITTHSPLILGGLASKHIIILHEGNPYSVEDTYGREIDDILQIVMQVDAGKFTHEIKWIAQLIALNRLEEAEIQINLMQNEIDQKGDNGGEHPDVLMMKSLLTRKKILGK